MIEFWGVSQTLRYLSESLAVALQVGVKEACVLADVFHMAKGGSPFEGLRLLGPYTMGLLHLNDYPDRTMDTLTDADRIFPGDGAAPSGKIISTLYEVGYRGTLSIELFNTDYWQQDALLVARTALQKTHNLVQRAVINMLDIPRFDKV